MEIVGGRSCEKEINLKIRNEVQKVILMYNLRNISSSFMKYSTVKFNFKNMLYF